LGQVARLVEVELAVGIGVSGSADRCGCGSRWCSGCSMRGCPCSGWPWGGAGRGERPRAVGPLARRALLIIVGVASLFLARRGSGRGVPGPGSPAGSAALAARVPSGPADCGGRQP